MNLWTKFKTDLWIWLNQIDNDSVVSEILMETLNQDTEPDVSVSDAIGSVMDAICSLAAIHKTDDSLQEMYNDLQDNYQ